MRCADLNNNRLKIFGTLFSYNEKLKEDEKFYTSVTNIQRILKIWKVKNLTPEGKIVIFKRLARSKIVFQSLITNELEKIQKAFLWKNSSTNIKHETLCNDFKAGNLKDIDISKRKL